MTPSTQSTSSSETAVWSIWRFYQQAWALLRRNNQIWLLVLAMMVVVGSSNADFNNSSRSSSSDDETATISRTKTSGPVNSLTSSTKNTVSDTQVSTQWYGEKKMVGESQLEPTLERLLENPWELFTKQPFWWFGLIIINVVFMIAWAVAYSFAASSWVQAALLWAVDAESRLKTWRLPEALIAGFRLIGSFIWLDWVPGIAFIIGTIVSLIPAGILIAIGVGLTEVTPVAWVVPISVGILWVGLFFYAILKLGFLSQIARRLLFSGVTQADRAMQEAWRMTKGTSWKFLRVSISLGLSSMLTLLVLLLPFIAFGFWFFMAKMYTSVAMIVVAVVLLFVFAIGAWILEVFWTGMQVAVWQYVHLWLLQVTNWQMPVVSQDQEK